MNQFYFSANTENFHLHQLSNVRKVVKAKENLYLIFLYFNKLVDFLKAFGYGSHAITVLNAARRRHVNNQGNENNECEILTVTLKLFSD